MGLNQIKGQELGCYLHPMLQIDGYRRSQGKKEDRMISFFIGLEDGITDETTMAKLFTDNGQHNRRVDC